MRPLIAGSIAAIALAASIPAVSHADDTVAPPAVEAVDVGTATIPAVSDEQARSAERADEDAADLVAELPARRTDDFGLVGVTWTRGFDATGMTVQVRLRADRAWSDWEELEVHDDEGAGGRDGTEPLWVGAADGVSVRVTSPTGERPTGLSVTTIDPGTIRSESTSSTASNAMYSTADSTAIQAVDGSPTYTPRPAIISRSDWGARRNTSCDSPRHGNETRGIVVHHTAGSNSYTASHSKSIVRAVQAYHMDGRDWCDIGYNFLVDKYGQVFEGRNGGTDRAVRGAHAGDLSVNTYTMGVSMMGTFEGSEPTAATKTAMVQLIGWRLGTTFHPATGTYSVGSRQLHRIAGHRNVVSTACPGAAAYAWLSRADGLRDRVSAYTASYASAIKSRWQELGSARTGPVAVGEYAFTNDGGGRKARLLNLDLYSSSRGTFSVGGEYRSTYATLGSQTGSLGAPAGEAEATSRSVVSLQRFGHGTVYRVVRGGNAKAYGIWGAMYDKYASLGEASSALGAPSSNQVAISGGRSRAYFGYGYMTVQADGTVTVTMT
ncbi:N-acetylmuramoyl-L-alanine amidase [Aeromicrobium sp.]|uniref:N-acetylmuramoyl-L-alanine amidase n=1 Tax=Aeromicrobium sp. TaxID=1871063 RepID=UPI0030C0CDA5